MNFKITCRIMSIKFFGSLAVSASVTYFRRCTLDPASDLFCLLPEISYSASIFNHINVKIVFLLIKIFN
ncbi:hypothetical protein DERP_008632 [Dermatophagoides pteronyssinus]|uniref:Secreted protein n=1 Tax=Dermatophagoides pteronyssinus TaxID=6956 RepID=A0ABQ8IX76_DERPT|nr:hypothetical protein DERP_008632 [Dermatophagoides pteronyssinus]